MFRNLEKHRARIGSAKMPGHILKFSTGWTDDPMLIDINSIRVVVQRTICLQEPGLHPVGFEDI
eukprot:1868239-Prorocentrum_lima.AAC.1